MKTYLTLLLVAFSVAVNAQNLFPKYGTLPSDDNTGRVLTYGFNNSNDVAGNDTLTVVARDFETIVRPTANIVDSVNVKAPLNWASVGDRLTVFVSKGTSNGAVRFPSTYFICDVSANRYTISANKSAVFVFRCNGSKWILQSKVIQP